MEASMEEDLLPCKLVELSMEGLRTLNCLWMWKLPVLPSIAA